MKREPNSLVLTPAWNGLKQQVLHLAQFGGSIQVLQGAEGAGKTTFFSLISSEDLGSPLIRLTVDSGGGSEVLFAELAASLGLRPSSSASFGELIASLRGFVQSQYQERARTVVALDDAHLLSEAALAALISVLQGGSDSGVGLHLIFFAESGLVDLIDSLNLLDVTVHDAQLPAFSPSEIKSLLLGYFASKPDTPLIGAEQVHSIWVDSKGLPGKALRLASSAFSPDEKQGSLFSMGGLPVAHLLALFVLLGVLSVFFLMSRLGDDVASEVADRSPGVLIATQSEKVIDNELDSLASPLASDEQISSDATLNLIRSERERDSSVPVIVPSSGSRGRAGESGEASLTSERETLSADVEAEVHSVNELVGVPSSGAELTLKEKPEKNSVSEVSADIGEPLPVVVVESPIDVEVLKSEGELLAYPGSGYVIQLMALADLDKLKRYVREQPNQGHLHIYEALRKGRVFYILVEGFYADKASSLMAIKNLPKQQKRAGPWPKNLEVIHREIGVNRSK